MVWCNVAAHPPEVYHLPDDQIAVGHQCRVEAMAAAVHH